jgi:hypothetical protein
MQPQRVRPQLNWVTSPRFVLPVFAIVGLIGILNHAMWRDEMNTWLIVRDSSSLGEMLSYVNYQGHPALWALLVSLVSNIADTPVIMQLLNWLLGTSAILVFWRYSRFSRLQKTLFTFSYLPFYEYLLISRPYMLGMLFIFLFCALYPSRQRSYFGLAITLGLMANSHAFAALISLAGFLTLSLEFCLDSEQRSRYLSRARKYDLLLSLIILVALYAFAFAILNPPLDSANVGGREGWFFAFDLRYLLRVFGQLLGGYVLIIPNDRRWFDLILCDVIGFSILLLTAIKLIRNRTPFLFFLLANAMLLSFFYFRYMGLGARHYGFFYLVFIAGLWLSQYYSKADFITIDRLKFGSRSFSVNKILQIVLMITLLFHFGGGLYRFSLEFFVPFSAGRETAQYIRDSNLENEFIVASRDVSVASIPGYLNRKLYYPELQGMGSFTIYQKGRRTEVDQADILEQINTLLPTVENCRILLILNNQELAVTHPALNVVPLARFERSWHSGERMYLYWATSKKQPAQCQR